MKTDKTTGVPKMEIPPKPPQKAIKNVIVLIKQQQMECWGSLSEVCRIYKWNYNTLVKRKFPFAQSAWIINKVPFRESSLIVEPEKKKIDGK